MPNEIPVKSLSISRDTSEKLSRFASDYNTNESFILECALKEFFKKHEGEEILYLPDGVTLTAR